MEEVTRARDSPCSMNFFVGGNSGSVRGFEGGSLGRATSTAIRWAGVKEVKNLESEGLGHPGRGRTARCGGPFFVDRPAMSGAAGQGIHFADRRGGRRRRIAWISADFRAD